MEEKSENLVKLFFCRQYLYFNGMLTEKENEKIHEKIMKYQDENRIHVDKDMIDSIDFTFETENKNVE